MNVTDVKTIAYDMIKSSTVHGLPRIWQSKNRAICFVWTICSIMCYGFFSYFTIMYIISYFKYEVYTTINLISETPTLFPTITICNYNSKTNLYKLNETILKSRFGGADIDLTNFETIYNAQLGQCFRFNSFNDSSEAKRVHFSGKYEGLELELFSGLKDTKPTLSAGYGFRIFIHNKSDNLDKINKGVDVSPGFQTSIVLDRIFYQKLSRPYDDCFIDLETTNYYMPELIEKILSEKQSYQQETCFEYCRMHMLNERCNCTILLDNIYECTNANFNKSCQDEINHNFYSGLFKECLKYCPLECNTQEFKLRTSILEYPHLSRMDSLKNNEIAKSILNKYNITMDDFRKRLLSLCVYYDELKYTVYSKEPYMDFSNLMSYIGGLTGVFLGASFLTFVEVIEFLLKLFIIEK